MLRILVGAETFAPDVNGAARFADRLSAGLAARGHEVHVVAPSPEGSAGVEERDGVVVHRVTSRHLPGLDAMRVCLPWDAAREVREVYERVRPDVVHTNGHMSLGRAVVNQARRTGVPLVATNHLMPENIVGYLPIPESMHDAFAEWMYRDLGRVYSRADVVTAPTPRAVDLITRRAGLTAAFPVSNGIDADAYERARAGVVARRAGSALPPAAAHEPTVLFVGRLNQEKRVDELIRAFARIAPDVPGRLDVVGDGERRAAWEALSVELGVTDRVRFRGFLSDEELLEAYASADLFCMPGVAELQSIVTMEAMAARLPVIAADAMALPHLVKPGVNGELFQPGDIGELAGHLRSLLTDATLRERYGDASRELIQAHTMGATLGVFETLYEKVMGVVPVAA